MYNKKQRTSVTQHSTKHSSILCSAKSRQRFIKWINPTPLLAAPLWVVIDIRLFCSYHSRHVVLAKKNVHLPPVEGGVNGRLRWGSFWISINLERSNFSRLWSTYHNWTAMISLPAASTRCPVETNRYKYLPNYLMTIPRWDSTSWGVVFGRIVSRTTTRRYTTVVPNLLWLN